MARSVFRCLTAALAVFAVSACAGREPRLLNLETGNSGNPDEFLILPTKPLAVPSDTSSLPEPTPGGANRADPTPEEDAVAALGGDPARLRDQSIPDTDEGMVRYASRYGVDPGIRRTLADEDLEFRRENDGLLLERMLNLNLYFKAYRGQSLNQHRELERLRVLGVRTVSAPPAPENPSFLDANAARTR